mmetsp:Transcript_15633/g.25628  ORF Transcript_15633/g.25628 Transcript_15633/m.25628 type:complete len:186 (+) Transcript_15633:62-619(+)
MAEVTPRNKKRKVEEQPDTNGLSSPLLKTPHKVLKEVQDGNEAGQIAGQQSVKAVQALCSCVVAMSSEDKAEASSAEGVLKDLLDAHVDPNYIDDEILRKMGGSPLFLAAKLDVPKAVEMLLSAGASLVQGNDEETPLQAAIRLDHTGVCQLMFDHIEKLEVAVYEEGGKAAAGKQQGGSSAANK